MGATYTAYPDLNTPNEVITKMRDFVASKGYEIIQDLTDDLDIFDKSVSDGKKFTFLDKSQTYFINMRSQNGINISENMEEMTRLMYYVSFEDLFQLNEIIERKFS